MIRLLGEADRRAALTLLQRAPALNLYALGNLESLGFDSAISQFWGDVDAIGTLRALLNRYMTGWVIYGSASADWEGLGQIVDSHPMQAERLQDNPEGVESFLPYLHNYRAQRIETETLMTLAAADFRPQPPPPGATVRRALDTDLDALIALYADAQEMRRSAEAVRRPLQSRRIWIAEVNGRIESVALTNAETADLAMVGGVYTKPDARGRGLSRAVVSALCAELHAQKRQPVLYWVNPAAGAVYDKLGFRQIGVWRAIRLEPVENATIRRS